MTQAPAIDRRRAGSSSSPLPLGALGAGATLLAGGALMMNDVPLAGAAACVAPPLAVVGFAQWRGAKRRQLRSDLAEGLIPLTGPGVDVRCSRWAKREYIHPLPGRIEIRYGAGSRDWDPKWMQQLTATVEARVGVDYKVEKHQSSRKRVYLVPEISAEEISDDSPRAVLARKADVVIRELLGKE